MYLDNVYLEDGQCVLGYVAVLGQCVLGRWTMFICVNMLLYCTLFIIFELLVAVFVRMNSEIAFVTGFVNWE